MIVRKAFLSLLMYFMSSSAFAAIDTYQFDTKSQEQRFFSLTNELRCPKCQNQSIADSDAPIANDLRREVHRMLLAGEKNETIVEFMLSRYGDFVLYRPRLESKTALLWAGPPLLLLIGLLVLFAIVRRHRYVAVPDFNEQQDRWKQSRKEERL